MCDPFTAMAVGQGAMNAAGGVMAAHDRNKSTIKAAELNNKATIFNMESNEISRGESRVAYAHRMDAINRAARKAKGAALVSGAEAGVVPDDVVDALVFDISDARRTERISQDNAELSFSRRDLSIQLGAEQQRSQLQTTSLFGAILGGLLGIGGSVAQGQLQNKQYQALNNPNG